MMVATTDASRADIGQGNMSSERGRRRSSVLIRTKLGRFWISPRSLSSSRRQDEPVQDTVLLKDKDATLDNKHLWVTPIVEQDDSEELPRIKSETEALLEKNSLPLEQNELESTKLDTKSLGRRMIRPWKTVSKIGRPWQSVRSETSSDDDSTESSLDEQTALTIASTVSMSPIRASTVDEVVTPSKKENEPVLGGDCPALEDKTCTAAKEDDDDGCSPVYSDPIDEFKQAGEISLPVYSVPFDEFKLAGEINTEKEEEISIEEDNFETAFVSSLANEPSNVSKLVVTSSNPFNKNQAHSSEDVKAGSSKPDVVPSENEGMDKSTLKEPTPSVTVVVERFSPTSALPSGSDEMAIKMSDSNDTEVSSNDSIWGDIEVRRMKNDEWVSFDQEENAHAKSGKNNVAPLDDDQQDAYPGDEASFGTPSLTPLARRKHCTRPLLEARSATQQKSMASRKQGNVGLSSNVSVEIEQPDEPTKETAYTEFVLQFGKVRGDCTGLYSACLTASLGSCSLIVAIVRYVMEGVSENCCKGNVDRNEQGPRRRTNQGSAREKKKKKSKRAPVPEIRFEQKSSERVPMGEIKDTAFGTTPVFDARETPETNERARASTYRPAATKAASPDAFVKSFRQTRGASFEFPSPAFFDESADIAAWMPSKFEAHDSDEKLLEDVERFIIALRPIKECQQQVRELRHDITRNKEERAREVWFWRQHEAKWKTRLPFHSADITYNADAHFY